MGLIVLCSGGGGGGVVCVCPLAGVSRFAPWAPPPPPRGPQSPRAPTSAEEGGAGAFPADAAMPIYGQAGAVPGTPTRAARHRPPRGGTSWPGLPPSPAGRRRPGTRRDPAMTPVGGLVYRGALCNPHLPGGCARAPPLPNPAPRWRWRGWSGTRRAQGGSVRPCPPSAATGPAPSAWTRRGGGRCWVRSGSGGGVGGRLHVARLRFALGWGRGVLPPAPVSLPPPRLLL